MKQIVINENEVSRKHEIHRTLNCDSNFMFAAAISLILSASRAEKIPVEKTIDIVALKLREANIKNL